MKRIALQSLALFITLISFAQTNLTNEDIWAKYKFYENSIGSIAWMNDGKYYSALEENKLNKVAVASGKTVSTLLDGSTLEPKIDINSYSFSADESQVLLETNIESIYRHSYTAVYYLYNFKAKTLKKLADGNPIMFATLSPDGKKVAYVKENNLYFAELENLKEIQITTDGKKNNIINGWADWVYEEEFGQATAFSWSPDSKKIGFLKFDESRVKEYNMQTWGKLYPEDYRFKYPKAGEENSFVSALSYDLAQNKTTLLEDGNNKDQYIPRIFWTNSSSEILIFRLNRLQNNLEILKTNTETAVQKAIYTEKSTTYVEVFDDIAFLKLKNQFILASEKDGFKHLYLYDFEGNLINQITKGNFDILSLVNFDEKNSKVYYMSAENSPLEKQFYCINLDGSGKTALSKGEGTHSIDMSPDAKYYIDSYSKFNTPSTTTLFQTSGNKSITVLENNAELKKTLAEYNLGTQEAFSFKTSEGVELNGWMIKPKDFDPNKKYPVLMHVYGGPGIQTVNNEWEGQNYMWHQLLAQKGYIIVSIDNRGTGSRGSEFKKCTYGQLGYLEAKDQIEGAKYLAQQPFVDKSRIGIWGWSFGGYMTSLCLTIGSDYFKTGVAVAPVTSWRFYDSIYTERYLGLPKDNAKGYDDNSPLSHTNKLKGNYFIIHGTGDDNVHFQNAVEMQNSLIKANKQFDSFYYPNRNHGIYGGVTRLHLYNMMTYYILEKL